MPVPYTRELQKLQDEAPQTPWHQVQTMIPPHIREALTDLDETALASASIGQVHTARLRKTGERVVVKVQHPQARTLLLDDFKSTGRLLSHHSSVWNQTTPLLKC